MPCLRWGSMSLPHRSRKDTQESVTREVCALFQDTSNLSAYLAFSPVERPWCQISAVLLVRNYTMRVFVILACVFKAMILQAHLLASRIWSLMA